MRRQGKEFEKLKERLGERKMGEEMKIDGWKKKGTSWISA